MCGFWWETTGDALFHWKKILLLDLFQLLSSEDVNWWTGVVWITCGLWCFYQLFGLILTAPIHCRASISEQVMQCYISTNLMKKQTHPNLEQPEGEHFHFWVKYSIKGNQEQRVMRLTHSVTAHKEQQRSEQMLHSWIHAAHAGRSHWEHGFLEPETLWHTQHAEGAAAQPDDTQTPLLQQFRAYCTQKTKHHQGWLNDSLSKTSII